MKETDIQRQIMEGLAWRKILAWRNNSIGSPVRKNGKIVAYKPMDITGQPDIFAIIPPLGRLFGIEVKTEEGRQSPNQKAFQERMEAEGAIYCLARSWEDVDKVLRKYGF
jgi:hypothetical protein